jgi:hypothetical protein
VRPARVRRCLLALAVTFGILVLTPSPSWACSCAVATTQQHVRDAVTVAAGTVDWTATDGLTRTYKVDFDGVYKGAAGTSEKLVTSANEASCGLANLATGERYLFFIEGRHPGAMRVGLCGGTTGPPGKPVASPGSGIGGQPAERHTARTVTIGLGGALLLALAVGAVVARRRQRPATS